MELLEDIFKPKRKEAVKKKAEREGLESTEAERILGSRESESRRELDGASNTVVFTHLKDDGDAIFKPKSGETRFYFRKVERGTYFKRARASYLVSKFLGFDLVPPTVIRKLDGKIGSMQQFVESADTYFELLAEDKQRTLQKQRERLMALWIFDIIIWNSDRHSQNLLISDGIHAIDNDLSFVEDPLRVLYSYYDTAIPPHIIANLERFISSEDMKTTLRDLLLELLSEQEVNNCFYRIENIVKLTKKGSISLAEKGMLETYS